jgi:hypothetical protein
VIVSALKYTTVGPPSHNNQCKRKPRLCVYFLSSPVIYCCFVLLTLPLKACQQNLKVYSRIERLIACNYIYYYFGFKKRGIKIYYFSNAATYGVVGLKSCTSNPKLKYNYSRIMRVEM